jgi:hypothetical protein
VFSDEIALGRPYLAPPGVPVERVTALRNAFAAAMRDPAFLEDAKQIRLDVALTGGDTLQALAASLIGTGTDTLARAKAALNIEKVKTEKAGSAK